MTDYIVLYSVDRSADGYEPTPGWHSLSFESDAAPTSVEAVLSAAVQAQTDARRGAPHSEKAPRELRDWIRAVYAVGRAKPVYWHTDA